jgi:hypothetical protein
MNVTCTFTHTLPSTSCCSLTPITQTDVCSFSFTHTLHLLHILSSPHCLSLSSHAARRSASKAHTHMYTHIPIHKHTHTLFTRHFPFVPYAQHTQLAFFPAASLSYAEKCELNFGGLPFLYPVCNKSPIVRPKSDYEKFKIVR